MLVALTGSKGCGKSTIAEYWPRPHACLALADPMKAFCEQLWPDYRGALYGPSELREAHTLHRRADGRPLTMRHALQQLGTEWGRACDPEVWIRYALRRVPVLQTQGDVLITDCRFRNEAEAVLAAGGQVWCITRLGHDPYDTHPSEAGEAADLATHWFSNEGPLSELRATLLEAIRYAEGSSTGLAGDSGLAGTL